MRELHRRLLILAVVFALVVAVGYAWVLMQPSNAQGAYAQSQSTAHAETPYGESLTVNLGTSAGTSQSTGSWVAATATASQNVWTVNSTYKSQGQVTLGYSLSVSYSNVGSIQIVSLYIKAVDSADSSSYTYTLASNKALSGSSPITDSGSTTKTISQHLTDVAATQPCTIKYYIYCKVQGTGTISGQTLTAEVVETWFCTLNYQQSSESASANVTPSVNVASWADVLANTELVTAVALVLVGVAVAMTLLRKPKKGRGKRK